MQDNTETPSTEELASELSSIEGESPEPETAPETEPTPETPAEQAPEPTPTPTPPEPESEPDPPPDRVIAPPSSAQADKKASDSTRRKAAIANADRPSGEIDEAEEKRRGAIQEKLEAVQLELESHLEGIEACRIAARGLMSELYPHMGESDKLVDAVRGHIAAQKIIRKNRASNPARIAEILKQAGKSPIDAAFSVQRARGMSRPTRTPVKPKGDEGNGQAANAGQE